ncbi:MAG: hypothetical protein QM296_09790 [Bacillota bacterium]|nr:hypothetical protein [Bacillota bacterium]
MNKYSFCPLDIAAYIKWSQLSSWEEARLLRKLWPLAPQWLDPQACGKRFSTFEKRVFQQLYHLYTRGYVDEYSDPAGILDPADKRRPLMPRQHANMETWLKRITLLLVLEPQLPYIRVDIPQLVAQLKIRRLTKTLLRHTLTAARRLGLRVARADGQPADAPAILAEGTVRIGLTPASTARLAELYGDSAWLGDWSAIVQPQADHTDKKVLDECEE